MEKRIVITGLGVISPAGVTVADFWHNIQAGTPAAAPVTYFDTSTWPCKLAAQVRGFKPEAYVGAKKADRYDPSLLFAIAAAKDALTDSGLDSKKLNPRRVGVIEGASVTGVKNTTEGYVTLQQKGLRGIPLTRVLNAYVGGGSGEISIELGLEGPSISVATACSSGNDAMGYAAQAIKANVADVMIAGGAEAPIVAGYYGIFVNAGVMTRRNDNPMRAMVPFDEERCGFVLGEGAAFLVLEEMNHALARGARIYAEWRGHGQACDAYHGVATHPEGRGMKHAMERALFAAQMPLDGIDYVNAHGSATETNELVETQVYKQVFGRSAHRLQIGATKPVTGHLMGATAAIEAVVCALSIHHSVIPPTAQLRRPYAGCDLDYVPREARRYPVRATLNVNMGFGGKNTSVILSKFAV